MTAHNGSQAANGSASLGSIPPLPPWLLPPLAIAAVAVGLFAVAAFGALRATSTHPEFAERLAYEHEGTFGYVVETEPSRLYPGGRVVPIEADDGTTTAQPIYANLARTMTVTFDYVLATESAADVTGDLVLALEVRAGEGWTQRPIVTSPIPFDGSAASGAIALDLAQIRSLIEALELETGFTPSMYNLVVTPTVRLAGTIGGESVTETFKPAFTVSLSDTELVPETTLTRLEPTRIGETISIEDRHSFVGISTTVSNWRLVGVIGTVVGALAAGTLLAVWLLGIGRDEDGKIEVRYHSMLLPVVPDRDGPSGKVTRVASMHSLARLAKRDGGIIFVEAGARGHRYFVRDGDDTYEYVTGAPPLDGAHPFPRVDGLAREH